jgi:hypothetical protein
VQVRRFGLGLQLALLVSCGVASGYAWRAALSPGHDFQTRYIYGGKPFTPSWFFAPPSVRVVPIRPASRPASKNRHLKLRRAISARTAPASSSGAKGASVSRQLASVGASPHVAGSSPSPASPIPPRPKRPAHPRHHSPQPPPPAPPQPPVSPPSPPSSPPSPPAPPPVTPPPPAVSTVQTGGSRPGWGHGDPNHEHTGPPGKGRKSEAPPSSSVTSDDQSKGKGRWK